LSDRPLHDVDAAMERHANGDDAAFAEVFDAVAPRIASLARRALRDSAAADDIVQQTLLKMNRARGEFLPGAQVLPWAHTIARNLIRDRLRQRRREAELLRRVVSAATPELAGAADEQLVADETAAALRASFAALPPAQRDAYVMLRREGLSLAEAARRLRTTITAVKLRVHRAACRLRASLEDREDDDDLH
jgi:RNA polymerase sigma-70 factor, ECF subfamily